MKQCIEENRRDKGFSLMEVLVCIAILSIICIPIFRSFQTSSYYNKRAYETQGITSLMQTVTETVKYDAKQKIEAQITGAGGSVSTSVDTVRQGRFPASYPAECFTVTTCELSDIAIAGKLYKLTVVYDPLPYSEEKAAGTPPLMSAADDANVYPAAEVGGVDHMRFPVISDEISRYEGTETGGGAVLHNLLASLTEEEKDSFGASDAVRLQNIYRNTSKHTVVTISGSDSIRINCDVTYELNGTGRSVALTYNVYRAVYELEEIKNEDGSFREWGRGGKIYLFAKAWQDQYFLSNQPAYNSLAVDNRYTGAAPLDIYLVRGYYSDATAADPEASYKRGLHFDRVTVDGSDYYSLPCAAPLTGEYSNEAAGGKTKLHTNIKGVLSGRVLTSADMEETIGEERAGINCYEVKVTLAEQPGNTAVAHFETVKEVKD